MTRRAKRKWTEMNLSKICGQPFCGNGVEAGKGEERTDGD